MVSLLSRDFSANVHADCGPFEHNEDQVTVHTRLLSLPHLILLKTACFSPALFADG